MRRYSHPYLRLQCLALVMLTPAVPRADHIEELVVTAQHDRRSIELTSELHASPDVAQLLKIAPGANVNSNGPLTGIPQYRGMFGSRVATILGGTQLSPSGPNWMDPPLSYATSGHLQSLQLYRGIAPVSVAQESIGGAIEAQPDHGSFGDSAEFGVGGRAIGGVQSASDAYHLSTALYASNNRHRLKVAAMAEDGDDAEFPDGDILPSEYQRQRYDIGYGLRHGAHTLQFNYGYNDTGDSGTPALPMDINYIEGDLYGASYDYDDGGRLQLDIDLYGSNLDHGMTNYGLREAPPPAARRRNTAESDNAGFRASARILDDGGSWVLGLDGFHAEHDSDIDNPENPMFFVTNFNQAERTVLGAFAERHGNHGDHWRSEFGLRYNRVEMDAGEVDGTPAQMMPPAMALRDNFNSADRERNDNNIDLVARAWYKASDRSSWYLGVAQKKRSPSHQERYLWLPLEATGGLADGNTYTGNITLDPEVLRQVEMGLDFSGARLTVSPRLFYGVVDDYIQGTAEADPAAAAMVAMMNRQNGTNRPPPLRFNNVDAIIYGFDMDWALGLGDHWRLSGLVNYVRGERDDSSDDDLYRIAPLNGSLRLDYAGQRWGAGLEMVAYAEQDRVSATLREQETSGYAVFNVSARWQVTPGLQLAGGVDNLFDRDYEEQLGGYNRAANPDIAIGERLPARGANLFARLLYEF